MLIKEISFPSYLEEAQEIEIGNIDIFIKLESDNDYPYMVTVATPKNR